MHRGWVAVLLLGVITQLCFCRVHGWRRKLIPARGLENLKVVSPECEHYLRLPYKPAKAPPDKYNPMGTHSFVFMSAYRLGARQFAVLGMGSLAMHDTWGAKEGTCLWISLHGPQEIWGKVSYIFPGEHHDLTYEVVTIRCNLEEPTPSTAGGALFINIHGEDVMVYKDKKGVIGLEPSHPTKHKLTFCSPPIDHRVTPARVLENLLYNQALGVDYFILYDAGGVGPELRKLLEPFQKSGLLEVVDVRLQHRYKMWHHVFTVNDCAYRTRFSSEWVLTHDFDDYLELSGNATLLSLLQQHEQKPWITFGTLMWAIDICCPSTGEVNQWPIERMEFHWPDFYCMGSPTEKKELCRSYHGFRRYIVNPRRIDALEIHRVKIPEHGGEDLPTSIAHFNRYAGLSLPNALICDQQVVHGQNVEWWVRTFDFPKSILSLRNSRDTKQAKT